MIKIYHISNQHQLSREEWERLFEFLPLGLRAPVGRYRRWQDRQASLYGKLLLRHCLMHFFGNDLLLHNYRTDDYQRPFLSKALDFNISHTAGMVVCAATINGRLGIDVEKIRPITLAEFKRVFSPREWALLQQQSDHHSLFFDLWCRKEAIMKADGRGFQLPPHSFEGLTDQVPIAGVDWRISSLDCGPAWTARLAYNQEQLIDSVALDLKDLGLDRI